MLRTLILFLAALPAFAQDYPAREIRSICNFAAGSGADIIVRYYSDRLSRLAGKPVLVENRPGAQGTVATDYVAKSKPDGYTIMITPASSTLATAPHIFKTLPFDPAKDFAPVTTITSLSFVIAVDAQANQVHPSDSFSKQNGMASTARARIQARLRPITSRSGRACRRPMSTSRPRSARSRRSSTARSTSSPTTPPGR